MHYVYIQHIKHMSLEKILHISASTKFLKIIAISE